MKCMENKKKGVIQGGIDNKCRERKWYSEEVWIGKAPRAHLSLVSTQLFKNTNCRVSDQLALGLSLWTVNEGSSLPQSKVFGDEEPELLENSFL